MLPLRRPLPPEAVEGVLEQPRQLGEIERSVQPASDSVLADRLRRVTGGSSAEEEALATATRPSLGQLSGPSQI